MMNDILYLEGKFVLGNLCVTTSSFMTLFVLSCYENLHLNIVIVDYSLLKENYSNLHEIKFSFKFMLETKSIKDCPQMVQSCKLPAIQSDGKLWCTSGLSGTLRHILLIKVSHSGDQLSERLLGFRSSCLQSCAEVSIWTKFCEVEVIEMVDKWVSNEYTDKSILIPDEAARFENHLKCSPITHNALKRIQELFGQSLAKAELAEMKRKKLHELPNLEHKYAEGPDLTLADLFIFSAFSFLFMSADLNDYFQKCLPLTYTWYHLIKSEKFIKKSLPLLSVCQRSLFSTIGSPLSLIVPIVPEESLYKGDPARYKSRWRAFTNQSDIDVCIDKLQSLHFSEVDVDIEIVQEMKALSNKISSIKIEEKNFGEYEIINVAKFEFNNKINWKNLPIEINMNKQLPAKRLDRKQQQLENMFISVRSIAKPADIIVDFCSGSGYLGILLAYYLPDCIIYLVENKKISLNRAFETVVSLGLKNIRFYHCNLDYFYGSFNIGVCLHACGVATDLVIKKCVNAKASFVCSPCCYGSIKSNHILTYPRSQLYIKDFKITSENYYILSHSADQTHDEQNPKTLQGKQCMRLIDIDRLSYATEVGYETILAVMNPPSCTPKNHILIGNNITMFLN